MALSIYDVTIPALIRGLGESLGDPGEGGSRGQCDGDRSKRLSAGEIGSRHVSSHGPGSARQRYCKGLRRASWRGQRSQLRRHGNDVPELEERLAKTVSLLRGVKAADLEGAAERRVEMKFGERTVVLDGFSYVTGFVLANFYFHVATAYDLLRYKGLKIGKADYIGMDGLEAKAEA